MRPVTSLEELGQDRPSLITIGAFDGVHRGHQALIGQMVAAAHATERAAIVLTFFPHPSVVLRGRRPSFYLSSPEEKAEYLMELGVDVTVTHPFNQAVSEIRASEFVERLLSYARLSELWCGPDFALGHNREGTVDFLQAQGRRRGFEVRVMAPVLIDGEVISSTRIRQTLRDGAVDQAARYLGRPFRLGGQVVEGAKRGRQLGIPTANLSISEERAAPAVGVYACHAAAPGWQGQAVVNIGFRPTFAGGEARPTVEAHLLDYSGDLYGQTVALDFVARLRAEIKFPGVPALLEQIQRDILEAPEDIGVKRDIYLLSPKTLSPETIAVAFAKTSRSPESFRAIAAELSDEKSAQFHEKWVVGYGHASVAEHAVLHIAVENVSRLAIETLESNRLASYTEKSTRYQVWGQESFYTPQVIAASQHAQLYRDTLTRLFDHYRQSLGPVRQLMQAQHPRKEGESEARWDGRIRSRYVDCCRFWLPAASLANVGVTANARVLESAIRKLLSHPLEEVREIGAEVKSVAQAEVPTLLKYANEVPYQRDTLAALGRAVGQAVPAQLGGAGVTLVDYDPLAERKFLAACLYRFGHGAMSECRARVDAMTPEQQSALAGEALGRLDRYDVPLRELEHVTYTFDAVMDQGGYFEIKRHRMMTQSPQRLTCHLGLAVPRAFEAAGQRVDYETTMQATAEAYQRLSQDFPEEASYIVPNGFNRRVLLTLNLREAFHLCELRGAATAHFSARRTAGQIFEQVARVHPLLAGFMRCRDNPHWSEIERENFAAVA